MFYRYNYVVILLLLGSLNHKCVRPLIVCAKYIEKIQATKQTAFSSCISMQIPVFKLLVAGLEQILE